jgi:hypothetical protein
VPATLNYRQIPDAVAARQPFQGNSMSAERVAPGRYVRFGFLSQADAKLLDQAADDAKHKGETLYVVYSYGTPIAWGLDGRDLYVPEVRYSVTSGRHQGICRRNAIHTVYMEA